MKNSKIEWCDHTFNPWIGCTKVSPGCANCYAETQDQRRFSKVLPGCSKNAPVSHWGKGAPRYRTQPAKRNEVMEWNREHEKRLRQMGEGECANCGSRNWYKDPSKAITCSDCAGTARKYPARPRVFCASLADWLDDEVPIAWLRDLLSLVQSTPNLDWLLLSKRPQNWRSRLEAIACNATLRCGIHGGWLYAWLAGTAPANVWIGTTVEDQTRADERIPALLSIPARVRFLSCEPLLGPVSLEPWVNKGEWNGEDMGCELPGIHWLIAGGESGPRARPMHPDWARSLRDQCDAAGVPFLFKQWGEWAPWERGVEYPKVTKGDFVMLNGSKYAPGNFSSPCQSVMRIGKKTAGRLLDGVEHNGFPTGGAK